MNIETAKKHIGKMVMSLDAGDKMIYAVVKPHGPYRLLKITKAGMAILEGREDERIRPSLLMEINTKEVLFVDGPAEGKVLNCAGEITKIKFYHESDYVEYIIKQDEDGEWIGVVEK